MDLFSKVAFKISEDVDDDSVVVSCVHANSDVGVYFQNKPMLVVRKIKFLPYFVMVIYTEKLRLRA